MGTKSNTSSQDTPLFETELTGSQSNSYSSTGRGRSAYSRSDTRTGQPVEEDDKLRILYEDLSGKYYALFARVRKLEEYNENKDDELKGVGFLIFLCQILLIMMPAVSLILGAFVVYKHFDTYLSNTFWNFLFTAISLGTVVELCWVPKKISEMEGRYREIDKEVRENSSKMSMIDYKLNIK